jgi:chromosome segregation ATPase
MVDDGQWLRLALESLQNDIRYVRQQFDALAQRITVLEARMSDQQQTRQQARRATTAWVAIGIAASSLIWSMLWTLLH